MHRRTTAAAVLPPELGNLTNLKLLNTASAQLTGSLPSELGALTSLNRFRNHSNFLTGSIPASFGGMIEQGQAGTPWH